MQATEQYFQDCGAVYIAVQGGSNSTLESVNEILKCDHSNESYCTAIVCGAP